MSFKFLDSINNTIIFVYLIAALISWAIFYYTVKAAVKNGILEAKETKIINESVDTTKPINLETVNDIDVLHFLYNSAQISLADYQKKLMELQEKK